MKIKSLATYKFMNFDIRDRIIHHAIEFRNASIKNAKIMEEIKDDKVKLEKHLKDNAQDNLTLVNNLFSLLDEYEAINGKVKEDL